MSFITCEFRFTMLRVVWISEIELIISENFKSPLVSPGELSKYGHDKQLLNIANRVFLAKEEET